MAQWPKTSPYASSPVVLRIGPKHKEYYVSRDLLQNTEWAASLHSRERNIDLLDVDDDMGHTLAHYLYTGTFQTLDDLTASPVEVRTEFKRAIEIYIAAKRYELHGLCRLAKQKYEKAGAEMNIFDMIEAIKDDFSKLPEDATWLHTYLCRKAETAFDEDHTIFVRNDFFGSIDNMAMTRALANCVMKLYNKVLRVFNTQEVPVSETRDMYINNAIDISIEAQRGGDKGDNWDTFGSGKKKKSKKEKKEEERLRKEEEERLAKEVEEEAAAAAAAEATKSPTTDFSWADRTRNNDDWTSFGTTTKKKKGKKGKSAETAPPPPLDIPAAPSVTTFNEILLDDSGGSAPKIDTNFGDFGTGKPTFGLSGLSSWTSGWGSSNKTSSGWGLDPTLDMSKDSTATNHNPWGSTEKRRKEGSSFDFDFDASKVTGVLAPVAKEKPAEDNGWDFSAAPTAKTKMKSKKSVLIQASIPDEPLPAPEPEKKDEEADPWSFSFGVTKDKRKKKDAAEEPLPPPPEPEPALEPEPVKEDNTWAGGWSSGITARKTKKAKKNAVEETPTSPEPEPEPSIPVEPEPETPKEEALAADPFAGLSKSQKKQLQQKMKEEAKAKEDEERQVKKEEEAAELKRKEEEAETERIRLEEEEAERKRKEEEDAAEAEKSKKKSDDLWGDWVGTTITTTVTKKKKKKGAKEEPKVEEQLPPPPEPEVVPELEPAPVEEKSTSWDDWGSTSAVVKKTKKKCSTTTAILDPPKEELVVELTPPLEPEAEAEPEPEPNPKTSTVWGLSSIWEGGAKKKKKGKVVDPEKETIIEEPQSVQEPVAVEEPKEGGEEDRGAPSWGKKIKKKNSKKDVPVEVIKDTYKPAQKTYEDDLRGSAAFNIGKKTEQERKDLLAPNAPTPPGDFALELSPPEENVALLVEEKKEATIGSSTSTTTSKKKNDETLDNSLQVELEQPHEAERVICPFRAEHLLKGDQWQTCKKCRALLRQVAIELARSGCPDEVEYEMVDHILIK